MTATKLPSGNADVDVLQVVLAGAVDDQLAARRRRPADGRDRDRPAAGEVGAGDRLLVGQQVLARAAVDDLAAVLAGARPDVDDPVGGADGVLVVLDDDQRVAQVAQPDQRLDQPAVVALVQPDRRLVQHVEHADQAGADLGGEPDPLRLAAGEGGRRPVERQVVQADVEQEAQPGVDLLEHPLGDHLLPVVSSRLASSSAQSPMDRLQTSAMFLPPMVTASDLGLEPGALRRPGTAPRACSPRTARGWCRSRPRPCRRSIQRDDALEGGVVGPLAAVPVAVADVHLVLGAVQDRLLGLGRQLLPRGVDAEPERRRAPRAGAGSTPAWCRRTRAGSRPRGGCAPRPG